MTNYDFLSQGFYQVGNVPYIGKIEALLAADACGKNVTFNFYDDVYSKYDWSVEPIDTLDQLYHKRALELRTKYDYLVLHYSAGTDSNNILETFIKHGLVFDELLMRGPFASVDKDISNTSAANMYAEVFFNGIPIANHVKDTYMPHLNIRVVDHSDYVLDFTRNDRTIKAMFDIESLGIGSVGPNLLAAKDLDGMVPEYRKIAETGKRIGHVFGVDKPNMSIVDGKYVVRFLDKSLQHIVTNRATSIDLPVYKELFYWGENTAPMIIKQAHTIKNYLNANNLKSTFLAMTRNRAYHDFIASIIYPKRKLPIRFNTEKVVGINPIMPWEGFFFNDTNADHYVKWKTHVDKIDSIVPVRFKHEGDTFNLMGTLTRDYVIGH